MRWTLWLVDSNPDDQLIIEQALIDPYWRARVEFLESAERAVQRLESSGPDELPHLIICNLALPGMSGFDFLKWLRGSRFKVIPVVMRASSDRQSDINHAYELGARAYSVKPNNAQDLRESFDLFCRFWFGQCVLPPAWQRSEARALT